MATAQLGTVLRHIQKLVAGHTTQEWTDRQLLDDFSAHRDETAFAALVARHGPMVLRVCRRVLNHEQDAEDAFQATFLVLARNTASIRKREALADWLHGVAYRTAMKVKRSAARRRTHEGQLKALAPKPAGGPTWEDVQAVLDEEIQRLPEPFRRAFVLCVLEGKSGPEAAAVLGCKEGTVSSRLTRARKQLQQRLAGRGIKLSALLAALALAEGSGKAAVPAVLARATIRFGLLVAAGRVTGGLIPSHVAVLAEGVTKAMFLTKAKIATAVLFAVSVLAAGTGALAYRTLAAKEVDGRQQAAAQAIEPPAAKKAVKPPAADDKDSFAYAGRVLGPDGKPVAGAKLYLTPWWGYHYEPFTSPESATTGPDGRFAFTAPKAKDRNLAAIVSAAAPNFGVGWVGFHKGDKRTDLTLKLVADDVAITGQVVDLEGKPVRDATVRVLQVMASPDEDLGPWLEATKDKTAPVRDRSTNLEQQYLSRYTTAPQAVVTTDAAGRFRITGVGRERLAILQLDGPTIASQYLRVRTRPGDAFEVPWMEAEPEYGTPRMAHTYYGSDFRHVAAPTKPVVGVVRDKDTKKSLAGVTVQSEKLAHNPVHGRHIVRTTTDAQGRYRLVGLPTGAGNRIKVVPPRDLPYVAPEVEVPDSPGLDPVTVDVELKRGVWIEGKLTDKVTGKPLRGSLMYLVRDNNPHQGDYLGFYGGLPGVSTNDDGTYRIVGLPGPGQIVVWRQEHYLRGADRDDEDGPPDDFGYMPSVNFGAFARVDPPKGAESVRRDITLVPGWTFTGTVLGPDGQPLAGARAFGLTGWTDWSRAGMTTAEFTVREFNPRRPRPVLFRHPEKGLVGVAQPPKENGAAVTVRMEPGATVTGRLVGADGEPRAGVELTLSFRLRKGFDGESYLPEPIKTDGAGRFRIPALLSGYEYRLSDDKGELPFGDGLRPGQTKDLGDVRIKPAGE
jgi:RNA polymerase sigma factor (sigma-70 family)